MIERLEEVLRKKFVCNHILGSTEVLMVESGSNILMLAISCQKFLKEYRFSSSVVNI